MNPRTPTHGIDPTFWLVITVWLLILVLSQGKRLGRWIQRYRAKSWPTTPGQIESVFTSQPKAASFSVTSWRSSPASVAEIVYSYSVAGQRQAGRYQKEFITEAEAWEFLRDLKGKSVAIHYNPNKPSSSALSEPSIETLTQARAPNPEAENLRFAPANYLPQWLKPFLWVFVALSALGLVLSLCVSIGAIAGHRAPPQKLLPILQLGIFVVWIPAALVAKRRAGMRRRKGYWKIVLHGAPDWMLYMVYGFSALAFIEMFLSFFRHANGGGVAIPPKNDVLGSPEIWMAFYAHAFAILYAALVDMGKLQRCVSGHPVPPNTTFCDRCGQPVVRA